MFLSFQYRMRAPISSGAGRLIIAIGLIAASSSALFAGQGRYTVGATADITGGGNGPNIPGAHVAQSNQNFVGFVGTYPGLSFKAAGEHSSLDASYGFGYDMNFSDPTYENRSHTARLAYQTKLGPDWSLNLSDGYSQTNNVSAFRLLGGANQITEENPEQFQYAFTPVFLQSNTSNIANLDLIRTFSKTSSLTVTGTYSTLNYPGNPQTAGVLSDQQRFAATIRYTHTGQHNSWSIGYSGARFNFAAFQNSLNHSAVFGYAHQFSPALSLNVDVGPSYLDTMENVKSPYGVNVTAVLTRTVKQGKFSLKGSQVSNDASGLGSMSTFREVAINGTHTFGKNLSVSADISGFDTNGLPLNAPSSRGYAAGGNVGLAIAREWSLNWGAQYQHYAGYNTPGYAQKRVFMSLRYSNPTLWRF